ncbi:MAG: ribbon-helix-helix domain-containing protein [Rhizobiaceae bacterium]|nr:ribbon-helix-helix domain-containing protein [Rhizobiaceae bacterium]
MSTVRKRSVSIGGHRTSYSIEDAFQAELNAIAETRGISLAALIAEIDAERDSETNLSSALRLFVLNELKRARQLAPKNILQFQ